MDNGVESRAIKRLVLGKIKIKREPRESIGQEEAAALKANAALIVECSNAWPFRWWRNEFCCAYCSDKFPHADLLRRHTLDEHSHNRIQFIDRHRRYEPVKLEVSDLHCELCSLPVDGLLALKAHLTSQHLKYVDMELDDGIIPFVLDESELRCQVCGRDFFAFSKLNNHMNDHYQRYICETCGKAFATPSRLRAHTQSHELGEFPCFRCDALFATRSSRNTHTATAHGPRNRYRCPHCTQTFYAYNDRMKHLTNVHNARALSLKCDLCPQVFTSVSARTKHVRYTHVHVKKHKCSLCASQFVAAHELRNHMVKHFGERKYQCDICKKAYARIKTLREHMRIHNNDRRFACSVCGQTFVQKCSLKQHLRVHHPSIIIA